MAALVPTPPERATGLPKARPLVRNWTVPVGVPAPGATALTVAVKVTDWPNTDGFTDEDTDVAVAAWLTVWVKGAAVLSLAVKVVSPLEAAGTEWDAVESVPTVILAVPPDRVTGL